MRPERGTALLLKALVGMPVLFGAVGFLAGALIAMVANHAGAALSETRSSDTR